MWLKAQKHYMCWTTHPGINCTSPTPHLPSILFVYFTIAAIFTMSDHGDLTHQAISSYFIGPQAENLGYFKDNISTILQELEDARKKYKFEGDQVPFSLCGQMHCTRPKLTSFRNSSHPASKTLRNSSALLGTSLMR